MRNRNFWILLLLLLAGIVLGGFLGNMAEGIPWLSWLNFGQSFGLDEPLILNLGVVVITFGLSIKITMAGILGVAAALVIIRHCKLGQQRLKTAEGCAGIQAKTKQPNSF